MKTIFHDDFHGQVADNWNTEQHTPDGYLDFIIRDGAMVFLDAGNRLLPRLPELHDVMVEGTFSVDWDITGGHFSLQIHLDYDSFRRCGTVVELVANGSALTAGVSRNGARLAKSRPHKRLLNKIIRAGTADFIIRFTGKSLTVTVCGEIICEAAIERHSGAIALSRGVFLGELQLHAFRVASSDPLPEEPVWDRLAIPFAPINGMDDPIVWTLTARRAGGVVRLSVELSGGCVERPVLPWFPYHGRYIEELTAPYLRIETDQSSITLQLSGKTLILCHHPQEHFYQLGPEKPEWPLRREFHLNGCSLENAVLACGYQAYNGRAINKHMAGGPSETIYDAARAAIVYHGDALGPGGSTAELRSSPRKWICRNLPQETHDYERASLFARLNHYFKAGEPCVFDFEIQPRGSVKDHSLRLEYQLENAFLEELAPLQVAEIKAETSSPLRETRVLTSQDVRFDGLGPGVYHIRFQLYRDGLRIMEKRRAFEIFSEDLSGPAASGLPVLFSLPTEIQGAETDYFDPWKPDCVDVSHYISVGCSIMPHFAREKRLWELYRFYGRQWLLWMTSRTAEDCRLEANRDLIRHCNSIESHNPMRAACLVRLASRAFYRSAVLEMLCEFACERNFHPGGIEKCLREKTLPPLSIFRELAEKHFQDWVDFFTAKYLAASQEHKQKILEINPDARISGYGPAAVYASSYKTAYSVPYLHGLPSGPESGTLYNGFFVFEDYPHACRYSIRRGPFLLADIRLKHPEWTVYPEMYTPFGEPCPDAAVARAWPSVGMWGDDFPFNSTVKRAAEYVYGSICHDGRGFHYRRDHGFHTRVWERGRYEALLRFWALVKQAPAVRPLRAPAFLCNEECCRRHPFFYDEYSGGGCDSLGDLFNTAEEALPYTYEMSRDAGLAAGFVTDFPALAALDADTTDILVLPPLTAAPPETLAQIRRLHAGGVALLAFEEVGGLEDLFGVEPGQMETVHEISVNHAMPDNPLAGMPVTREYTAHRACRGKYRSAGAGILLDAEVPVLFLHRNGDGVPAALFNVPPTVVRRQDQPHRVGYGRDSISPLINGAMRLLLRRLSRPQAIVDEGKLIAFRDTGDAVRLIVMEDNHPFPAQSIAPLVTINLPGLSPEKISCDRAFSLLDCTPDRARLRLALGPDEFAVVTIAN